MADQLQITTSQVEVVMNARDAAIQQGACDTAQYEAQLSALAAELQNLSARVQPIVGSPSTPSVVAPTPPLSQPSAVGSPPGATVPPPPQEKGAPESPKDPVSKLADLLQSMLSKLGDRGAGGGSTARAVPAGAGTGSQGAFPTPDSGLSPPGIATPAPGTVGPPPSPGDPGAPPSSALPSPGTGPPAQSSPPPGPGDPGAPPGSVSALPCPGFSRSGSIAKVNPSTTKQATVTGRVLDDKGSPVFGAQVAGGNAGSSHTNKQGQFCLQNLKPGQYHVTVTATGFRPENRTVSLKAGEVASVDFTLKGKMPTHNRPR